MAKFTKNHSFEAGTLNDLKTNVQKLMEQASTTSKKAEKEIAALRKLAAQVPAEAKDASFTAALQNAPVKMSSTEFEQCKRSVTKTVTKLQDQIPAKDAALGKALKEVTADAKKVTDAVKALKDLIQSGAFRGSDADFAAKVEAIDQKFDLVKIQMKNVGVAFWQYLKTYKGRHPENECAGDPINMCTGNFFCEKEELYLQGIRPLSFRRFYNVIDDQKGSLGKGWIHNYEVRLEVLETGLTLFREDGGEISCYPWEEHHFCNPVSGVLIEKTEDGYQYQTNAGESYRFDEAGKLRSQTDAQENAIFFIYHEKGQLKRAETKEGARLSYTYDEAGMLTKVCDHSGRSVAFAYQDGKLRRVTDPAGHTISYYYNRDGRISSITGKRGITTVTNLYDPHGRTLKQKLSDGGVLSFEYQDENNQVILTERNGSKITYVRDEKFRSIKTIYEDGEESCVYNDRNQKTQITDKNGNVTKYQYDQKGNITRIINACGQTQSMTYDHQNRLLNLSIEGKEVLKNTYDSSGNLIKSQDSLSRVSELCYNQKGQPVKIRKPDGSSLILMYDESGNIKEINLPNGARRSYTYDELNRVSSTQDGKGNKTEFTYNSQDYVTQVKNAEGNIRSYAYNETGKVTKLTDFDGSHIERSYNINNRPETLIDQSGRKTHLSYDIMNNLTKVVDEAGAETNYTYNAVNHLIGIRNAKGEEVHVTYDGNGNRTGVETAGESTRYTYDALNRLILIEGATGAKTRYTYGTHGKVTEIEDAQGNKISLEYDEAGQLSRETNPLGESRSYTYTALGKIKTITDEAGRTTNYAYLPGGQLSQIEHPEATKETYTYDQNGNIITHTRVTGETWTYHYDSLDRVIRVTGSEGEETSYHYDTLGKVRAVTDAKGNQTKYGYSPTGMLTKVTDPMGNETEYHYDERDQLIEIRQYGETGATGTTRTTGETGNTRGIGEPAPTQQVTRYQRDLLGQVERITDALGNQEHYTYNPKGQLSSKLDKEGYLTTYGYSVQGDVSHIRYADGKEVRLSYNALRQLEEVEDWLGITRIQSDVLGRTTKVIYPDGKEVKYTYGKAGERESITYPNGERVSYGYDELKRLSEVTDRVGSTHYSYNETGYLEKKQYPNGMETRYAYTKKGQLASLTHQDQEGILDQYRYRYDVQGNKIAIHKQRRGVASESGVYEYGYDALQRLTEVTKDEQVLRSYVYDAFGNRSQSIEHGKSQSQYKYNEMNQLIVRQDVGIEGERLTGSIRKEERYTYDKRGNLREVFKNDDLVNQYHFGVLNRLEKAVNHQTGEASSYQYNGLGHRVGRTIGNPIEPKLPTDKLQSLTIRPTKQIEDTIDLTKQYHNLLQRSEENNTISYTWDSNVLHAVREGIGTEGNTSAYSSYQYLQDELGSPIRLLGEDAVEQEVYGYDEFGQETTNINYSRINSQGIMQPFTYTGYQRDSIANTYYAQARDYIPSVGRFNGEDVIKGNIIRPLTMNQYAYCLNQPIDFIDLDGRDAILVNKVVDNFWGIEHMSGFFQDEKDDWYFFFWGDDVKVHKVEKPTALSDLGTMNEYLFENELYAKANKSYRDAVYIEGDFTKSVAYVKDLFDEYEKSLKNYNGKGLPNKEYNFFTNNCGHVTMEAFALGELPNGMTVAEYMEQNYYGSAMIPNWNMINMQKLFGNKSPEFSEFDCGE